MRKNLVKPEEKQKEKFARDYYEKLKANAARHTPVKPSKEKPENILYINTLAGRGGAAKAAYNNLCKPLRERKNYNTKMLVKQKFPNIHDENVQLSPRNTSDEQKILIDMHNKLGWLYFFNLGAFEIKDIGFFRQADILHLHNLHGGYFSPFVLPELTALKPTIWTLHDEQSYTGHCSSSFECEKWQSGCANCPDLDYYPAISTDTTDFLLKTKKQVYDNSYITYVCPSIWLKNRAARGILKDKDIRVIPNGIDEKVFCAQDRDSARKELNLPLDKTVLMFSADHSIENPQKGSHYVKQAYEYFKNRDDLLFLAIGGEHTAYIETNFFNVSYIFDENLLAKYYAASDLFIYPSFSETFGLVVAEAMSCRTPVVVFGNSALPELVSHMQTGYIARYKDTDDFIKGINIFLEDENLRKNASIKAREIIEKKFTIDISLNNHEKLYAEIWENTKK